MNVDKVVEELDDCAERTIAYLSVPTSGRLLFCNEGYIVVRLDNGLDVRLEDVMRYEISSNFGEATKLSVETRLSDFY